MTDATQVGAGELSAVKRALVEIRELRARVAQLEGAAREPIAIVGAALRAPGGVHDLADFATLLWSGADAITPIPPDRWDIEAWYDESQDAPGKMYTRHGGFLADLDQFDAEFFGISPREAQSMDPQQRLMLELAWEALEHAGHAPSDLDGTRAGVYLGISNNDYGRTLFAHPEQIDPYFSSGNASSVAAGRIAYFLGLQGPAISVDTACSSSLVAIHLACQGLRLGECDFALAGGVNLILTPELNVNFSKAGMMARDGRCKTFDAGADGYVRGEGAAFVVLRRLRDAVADGDRILAVVRGAAVNQDGRSNGLTAPNGPAQEAVIRAALESAAIAPHLVSYIEAHGTGTSLGDPIEVNALGAVFAAGRSTAHPVALGSVKTNIGHLEAAAGIMGLIKTVLSLQRRSIPPHLHLKTLNPYIDWASLPMQVPTATTEWQPVEGRRIAGVSSFGFSGTNAHVILEEAPPRDSGAGAALVRPCVLTISARDAQGLQQLAARHITALESLEQRGESLADYCFTANVGRAHFGHRLAVRASTRAEMVAALAAFRRGEAHPAVVSGEVSAEAPRVAFLFPGQGPQYVGMARELYASAPAFRQAFDRVADILDGLLPQPLRPIVFGEPAASGSLLDQTAYAQPAMFAIEVSLAALWRSWGIEPVAVMGHSFGEYAAAHLAGAVSLEDAARMVVARGRLVQALPTGGAMTVIEASEEAVRAAIAQQSGKVAVAAVNGPTNTVVSGERAAVDLIAAQFAARGARTKSLRVSHAFHSPLIEPVLDEFEREVSSVQFREPRLALVSNLSGQLADIAMIGKASYWREHMRESVRFADSVRALAALGITHYVEMSPHPVLLGMGSDCVTSGHWLPSLREGRDDWSVILESLQSLYVTGVPVDWKSFEGGTTRRRLELPTYPFRRKRHWMDLPDSHAPAISGAERWDRIVSALDRQAERGPLDLNAASYPAKWDCLARLTTALAVVTLRDAGLFTVAGERHSLDDVMKRARIGSSYHHLIHRWLGSLVEQRHLREERGEFVAVSALPDPGLDALWREAEVLFADNKPLLAYVRNCASLVAPVLTGRESPLETLFPGGSFELAQGLYERSTALRYINALAAAAFETVNAATPPGRTLRVLEIGAGTGGTSSSLLPVLSPRTSQYLFTDVSDVFLTNARARFGHLPFVQFGLFDLDSDYAQQGYRPGSFDVIVSANCVHAVKDLRAALKRLCSLLSPGGVLVLVESTTHLAYFDVTTGLIEGWQHFADDLRGDNPLLPPQTWIGALEQAGFAAARAWPRAGSVAEAIAQHVIIGRAPGDAAAGAVIAVGDAAQGAARADGADAAAAVAANEWLARFEQSMPAERLDLLREMVRDQVMRVLRLDAASPPARHERLMDLGMDSLMAVQLRNGLSRQLGLSRPLSSTLMFDYPTIDAIAEHLLDRVAPTASAAATSASDSPRLTPATVIDEAAVAGMSDDDIERLLNERLGSS